MRSAASHITDDRRRGRAVAALLVAAMLCAGIGVVLWLRASSTSSAASSAATPRAEAVAVAEPPREEPRQPVPKEPTAAPVEEAPPPSHYGPLDSFGNPKDVYGPSRFPVIRPEPGVPIDPSTWMTIGPLTRTPVPDSVFDAKYPPDTALGTLYGTAYLLEREVSRSIVSATLDLLGSGDFEEVVFPRNDEGEIEMTFYVGSANGDHTQMPRFAYWSAHDGGEHPSKIVWVRYDQFPELYDKLDEARYLRRRFEATEAGK